MRLIAILFIAAVWPSIGLADDVRDTVQVQQKAKPNVAPAPDNKDVENCVYDAAKELYKNLKNMSARQKAVIGKNTKDECLNETHPNGIWDDAASKAADKGLMRARDEGY